MTIDKTRTEARIVEGSPLPLTFTWQDNADGGHALRISVPVQTQAGLPQVIVAFPPNMPAAFQPKAIARAKTLINEIFEANMVGVVFVRQEGALVTPQKTLLLPGSVAVGLA